jgi:hypothetical protein
MNGRRRFTADVIRLAVDQLQNPDPEIIRQQSLWRIREGFARAIALGIELTPGEIEFCREHGWIGGENGVPGRPG